MGFLDMTREDKVAEFRKAGGKKVYEDAPNDSAMIYNCIAEEVEEFNEAALQYEANKNDETRANLCKEWADMQYVVSQAALYYSIPAGPAFQRVHDNNMTKVVDGKVKYRADGKILKPKGFQKVDMRGL